MTVIGLRIADEGLARETGRIIELLLAENERKKECGGVDERLSSAGFEVQNPAKLQETSFLVLSEKTAQESFVCAEALWEERPWLSVIFIAQEPEAVFAALPYPFFHVVRGYALEQDLGATVRKMERVRPPAQRWCTFLCKGGLVRVKQKDILYLESDRHEIKIHCVQECLTTAETLGQCEKKLEGAGFVRLHKSFLVNFYHVARLEKDCAVLDGGERIYISRYRYPEVKLQFENYIRRLDFLDG